MVLQNRKGCILQDPAQVLLRRMQKTIRFHLFPLEAGQPGVFRGAPCGYSVEESFQESKQRGGGEVVTCLWYWVTEVTPGGPSGHQRGLFSLPWLVNTTAKNGSRALRGKERHQCPGVKTQGDVFWCSGMGHELLSWVYCSLLVWWD